MRIISKWQESDEAHSIVEVANTIGFNAWKIAYKSIKNMQDSRLYFVSKYQGLLVIAEFMIYQIQIADRLAFTRMNEQERTYLIQTLAKKCLSILADNRADFEGLDTDDKYTEDFIVIFNERLAEYAEFSFDEKTGPSYQFYRYLGKKVGLIMGETDQDNKWAIDQVMEIEAPEIYQQFRHSFDSLYG